MRRFSTQRLKFEVVFFALPAIFVFQFCLADELLEGQTDAEADITEARRSEQITRNIEKLRREVADSLREIQVRTSLQPKIEVLMDKQTDYSLRQPKVGNLQPEIRHALQQFKIKGVTDIKARSLAAISSSISW